MSKLQEEIASTNTGDAASVHSDRDKQKVLVNSLLDSVTGGWVNAFVNWPRAI